MSDIKTKLDDWKKESESKWAGWRTAAKEDFNFRFGNQWESADKTAVEAQGRPAYTFNEIQSTIKLVCGYQRQNRQDIKIVGVEGGDLRLAEIMTLLIKNIMTHKKGDYKVSHLFQDGVVCSRGNIELAIDYEQDMITGDICLYHRSPLDISIDPYFKEYDLSDADYVLKQIPNLTEGKLLSLYPGQKAKIAMATAKPDADSLEKNRYVLTEAWYYKHKTKTFLVDVMRGTVEEQEKKITKQEEKAILSISPHLRLVQQQVPVPHVVSEVGDVILQDEVSPYYPALKTTPMISYISGWCPSAATMEQRCQGIARALKDPQRSINKRNSQALHIINTTANSGWVIDDDSLSEDEEDKLTRFGAAAGIVIKKKSGSQVERLTPVSAPMAQLILSDKNVDQIRRISGINPDLLGMSERQESGRALALRQQQGIITIQDVFDNLRYTTHELALSLMALIRHSYTPEKVIRVCGEDVTLEEAEAVLSIGDMSQYDIAIDEVSSSPTMRIANFMTLMEMKEKGFEAITEEDLIEASDLPNKDKILARIKEIGAGEGIPQNQGVPQRGGER